MQPAESPRARTFRPTIAIVALALTGVATRPTWPRPRSPVDCRSAVRSRAVAPSRPAHTPISRACRWRASASGSPASCMPRRGLGPHGLATCAGRVVRSRPLWRAERRVSHLPRARRHRGDLHLVCWLRGHRARRLVGSRPYPDARPLSTRSRPSAPKESRRGLMGHENGASWPSPVAQPLNQHVGAGTAPRRLS